MSRDIHELDLSMIIANDLLYLCYLAEYEESKEDAIKRYDNGSVQRNDGYFKIAVHKKGSFLVYMC